MRFNPGCGCCAPSPPPPTVLPCGPGGGISSQLYIHFAKVLGATCTCNVTCLLTSTGGTASSVSNAGNCFSTGYEPVWEGTITNSLGTITVQLIYFNTTGGNCNFFLCFDLNGTSQRQSTVFGIPSGDTSPFILDASNVTGGGNVLAAIEAGWVCDTCTGSYTIAFDMYE